MSFSKSVLAAIVIGAVATSATLVDFKPCDATTYAGKIDSIDVNPFPIKRGENVTITVTADTPNVIQGGQFEATVTAFGIKVLDLKQSFCDYTQCPIQPGKVTLAVTEAVSALAPPVNVEIKIIGTDLQQTGLFCEIVDTSISLFADEEPQPVKELNNW
eukprot:TRINITY_DN2924_c0_g1_i1.p1 TRINITY_DN2924_c0_g1~~TRINITY_DN2924_c0_g1_i1.p1  ORF type:complete len:159 (-),score=49.35 TRINITY_DN2924_c0_g1_i1:91-567(-)